MVLASIEIRKYTANHGIGVGVGDSHSPHRNRRVLVKLMEIGADTSNIAAQLGINAEQGRQQPGAGFAAGSAFRGGRE